jgi:hypothetical protein
MLENNKLLDGNFVVRYGAANSTSLVRDAINLLETTIKKEFGYTIRMGAELEFVVECNDDLPRELRANPFNLPSSLEVKRHNDFRPSGERDWVSQRDPFFPNDQYVAYSYKENCQIHPRYHCESILSHIADYGPTDIEEAGGTLTRMSALANAIRRVRNGLVRGDGGDQWREFRQKYVHNVNVSSYRAGLTNGLHLNFSLEKDGVALDPDEYIALHSHMAHANQDGMGLMVETSDQLTRFYARGIEKEQIGRGCDIKGQELDREDHDYYVYSHPPYIEQRIPAADGDPHLAVLVTLTGIYSALNEQRLQNAPNIPHNDIESGETIGMAVMKSDERLNDPNNLIRTTLNTLDPNHTIGDRIIDLVREHGCAISDSARFGQASGYSV